MKLNKLHILIILTGILTLILAVILYKTAIHTSHEQESVQEQTQLPNTISEPAQKSDIEQEHTSGSFSNDQLSDTSKIPIAKEGRAKSIKDGWLDASGIIHDEPIDNIGGTYNPNPKIPDEVKRIMSDDGMHTLKVFLVIDYGDSIDYCIVSDDNVLWYVLCSKEDGHTFYCTETDYDTVREFQEYMDSLGVTKLYSNKYWGYVYAKQIDRSTGELEIIEQSDMMKDLE